MDPIHIKSPGKNITIELTDPVSVDLAPPTDCSGVSKLYDEGEAAIPKLKAALLNERSAIRTAAVATARKLAESGVDVVDCLPELIFNLKDTYLENVKTAEFIGLIGERALPTLLNHMESDDGYYYSLGLAFFHLGQAAIEPMRRALRSERVRTRWTAMKYFNALFKDRPQAVTPAILSAVLEALRDSDEHVAGLAVFALEYAPIDLDRVVATLVDAYYGWMQPANLKTILYVLGRMEGKAAPALPALRQLMFEEQDFRLRDQALWAHCLVDKANALDTIHEFVHHHREVTERASLALMSMDRAGIRLLVEFLGDADSHIRYTAATALSQYDWPQYTAEALPTLARVMTDEKPGVRKEAANAVRSIATAISRKGKEVENEANGAGFLDAARDYAAPVIAVLSASLAEGEDSVRYDAARSLTWFGAWSEPAIPELVNLARSKKRQLRVAAFKALAAIDPDRAELMPLFGEWITGEKEIRAAIVGGLSRAVHHAEQAAALLEKAMADPDAAIRKAAATALKKLKRP